MAAINAKIQSLAPVLNTQSYQYDFNNNTDTMLKTYNGYAYIFADIGLLESPGTKTFTLPVGVGGASVEVVGEGRTIPVSNNTFTDNFAAEYTHHVYKIALTGGSSDTAGPSAPTGLTASAVSSTQINLTWTASTDNVGVTGYRVERCQGAGCSNFAQVGTPSGTTYNDTGLTASTAYSYRVRATDSAGNLSANSNTASATTQAGTPAPTVTISANPTSVSSGGSSTLTWSSANATSCTASGGWTGSKATSGTQTLTNLTTTTTYTLTCTGTGGSANNAATITVTPPSGGTITIGETTVFAGTDSGNGNLLLVQDAVLPQTATIQSLSFNVKTAAGNLRLGIYDATGPGGGPGALKAQTASFKPVAGWNTQPVVTPVSLPAGNYWLAYFPSSSSLSFATNFSIGSYKYANRTYGTMPATFPTVNGSGTTHWSLYATLSATPAGDTTAPSTPTNLTATAASPSQINLSWTASRDNVGVTGYKIFRGGVQIGTSATNSYSNTGLSPATAYSYTVSAYDAAGNNSAQSTSASATTLPLPPTAVISAAPQTIGSGDSSTLSWSSTNATSCTGTNFSTSGATSGTVVVSPAASTVYTVSCTGLGGTGTNTITVTVGALSALPTISFPSGTFTWTTTDAVSCTASGGWTGSVGTSGSYSFSAPVSTTYVLTCTGGGTTVQRTITVTTSETATVSSKFQSGQTVTTASTLNVRNAPSTSGTLLGTQLSGASGTVTGGPVQANGYWWWQVDYATGPDGWSVENWLN